MVLTILLVAAAAVPATAQTCDRTGCGFISCGTPVVAVPPTFWSSQLQPAETGQLPAERDQSIFDDEHDDYTRFPTYWGIDVQNGWAFTAMDYGVKIWDVHTSATPASSVSYLSLGQFLNGGDPNETKEPIKDVSLPQGIDTMGAVGGVGAVGIALIDFSNKSMPHVKYQNYNLEAAATHVQTVGANHYAFASATQAPSGGGLPGLYAYNLDAAMRLGTPCSESTRGSLCPGIYMGKIGTQNPKFLDGVDQYLVASNGSGQGFQIFDVTNPASATLKMSAYGDRRVDGVAMWKANSRYYLAAVTGTSFTIPNLPLEVQIMDVTCLTTSSCGSSPTVVSVVPILDVGTENYFVTYSTSGATPFLYVGNDLQCGGVMPQREYLLNVANPSAPFDITPPATTQGGYWGWYYRGNPTGFNKIMPRKAKFNGNYLYRVAGRIFDIHKHVGQQVPVADFSWSPTTVYQGAPVTFTDLSQGQPTSWSWTFQNGSPSTSPQEDPTVTFSATGPQTVSLIASNSLGAATPATHTVNVLSPAPAIAGGITLSPAAPLQCQPVTFTANGVTGEGPLTTTWAVTNVDNSPQAGGSSTTNPFTWDTGANAIPNGTYTVKVQATNAFGSPASAQTTVTLAPLPSLPVTIAPTNDPITTGNVQYHVAAAGATEWNWNFGDNPGGGPNHDGFVGVTTDPINGPNPNHAYASPGQYTAQVKVSNCLVAPNFVTSSTITVNVVVTLTAFFQATCSFAPCGFGVGQVIPFVDGSHGATSWAYDWNGTGNFSDSGHSSPVTSHTYTVAGTYSPALRVSNAGGGTATYTSSPIIVQGSAPPPPASPKIAVTGPTSGVPATNYTFFAGATNCTAAATWTWNPGGGTVVGSATGASITIKWASTGTFAVTASNSGCSGASGSQAITIGSTQTPPTGGSLQAIFTFSPASPTAGSNVVFDGTASTGSPTTYSWVFGDGTTGTGATANHVYSAAGTYTVKLDVVAPGSGATCQFGTCVNEATKTITVLTSDGAPPPTPLNSNFTSSGGCTNTGGFVFCNGTAKQALTLTAAEPRATSFSWSFGDGTTGSGSTVTHTFSAGGNFSVSLTVGATGFTTTTSTYTFQIAPAAAPTYQSLILPWVAETRGALVQSCDMYLHNPGSSPLDVTLEFLKRGTPDVNPPQATATIQPGATMYAADVLQSVFDRDNIAGFVTVTVKDTDPLPIITSFNTVVKTDGSQFGQTVPGFSLASVTSSTSSTAPDSSFQYLVGLNDNNDQLAYFGITNPTAAPATYHVRLYDNTGNLIGESNGDLTLGPFGQRQFQQEDVHSLFGLTSASDYRVSIENKGAGPIFPYGENVRLTSGDPSFLTAGPTTSSRAYVIGAFSTQGSWQSDMVLSNTGSQPSNVSLTFTHTGVQAPTTDPVTMTINPGQTERLSNAIANQWKVNNTVGVITVTSTSPNGVFPIVQGESYNNAQPANRYGQSMRAFTDADAASVGQTHYLVGLKQDDNHLTTLWVFNPSQTDVGVYDVIYRGLDGSVLGTVHDVSLLPGKVRSFLPTQHPLPASGVGNGFTVQVVVKNGKVLTAAQVLTTTTGDPAYVQGTAR